MFVDQEYQDAPVFACNMMALTPNQRTQHIATSTHLFGTIQEVNELANGYAFRLPEAVDTLVETANFITYERLCCPFLGFTLVVEPHETGVWLQLTGAEGMKPFLQAELGDYLTVTVAEQAGFQAALAQVEGGA